METSMLKLLYRKIINALLTVLVFIYLILEELIWERIAEPIYDFIRELKILQTLEQVILRLNRYTVLTLFLALFVAVESLGVVAIGLFANGQVIVASVVYLGKIPITAFTFWLFKVAKDTLMSFAWFKVCYEWLMSILLKIKTSAIYVNIKSKILSVKMWFKAFWASESVRRIKAMLGFKYT
jgi:hypothetical protein